MSLPSAIVLAGKSLPNTASPKIAGMHWTPQRTPRVKRGTSGAGLWEITKDKPQTVRRVL
jgi:hypothetical protein